MPKRKTYEFAKMNEIDFAKSLYTRNAHEKEFKMTKICDIISSMRQDAEKKQTYYSDIKKMRTSNDPDMRTKKLYSSRGTELAKEGESVLSFRLAGSGFITPRADRVGIKGKGTSILNVPKQEKPPLWARFVGAIDHSSPDIQGVSTKKKQPKKKLTSQQIEEIVRRKFGEGNQVVGGKKLEHVRKKEGENKTSYSISGPGGLFGFGLLNRGKYSIENVHNMVKTLGIQHLEQRLKEAKEKGTPPNELKLPVILNGHSRGAVSTMDGSMMLKKWVAENYPMYKNSVKFEIIQYDPVPGAGSREGIHDVVDLTDTKGLDLNKMEPLGDSAETTVMYSIHSNHESFFTPQTVKGANRVIITPFDHTSGLQGYDNTQKDGKHARAYYNPETDSVYRSSGLNQLPDGVYVVDEMNNIIRLNSMDEVKEVMNRSVENIPSGKRQQERYDAILASAQSCMERIMEKNKVNENKTDIKISFDDPQKLFRMRLWNEKTKEFEYAIPDGFTGKLTKEQENRIIDAASKDNLFFYENKDDLYPRRYDSKDREWKQAVDYDVLQGKAPKEPDKDKYVTTAPKEPKRPEHLIDSDNPERLKKPELSDYLKGKSEWKVRINKYFGWLGVYKDAAKEWKKSIEEYKRDSKQYEDYKKDIDRYRKDKASYDSYTEQKAKFDKWNENHKREVDNENIFGKNPALKEALRTEAKVRGWEIEKNVADKISAVKPKERSSVKEIQKEIQQGKDMENTRKRSNSLRQPSLRVIS